MKNDLDVEATLTKLVMRPHKWKKYYNARNRYLVETRPGPKNVPQWICTKGGCYANVSGWIHKRDLPKVWRISCVE